MQEKWDQKLPSFQKQTMSTAEKIKVKGEIELTKRTKLGQKKQV